MFVAFIFSLIVIASMMLAFFAVLYSVKRRYITLIFGVVLIGCIVATTTWTVSMIYTRIPAAIG